jgi:uncharacterized membrane protein YoaK (UPF0700 family)
MAQPPATSPAAVSPDAKPRPGTLISAILLAITGGLLDSVVYLLHGHVFANAMTGNVIFLGISALSHNWNQALLHIVPIAAFIGGVAASRFLRLLPERRSGISVLLLEAVTLAIAGLMPLTFPQMLFTAIISFVSAFQVSTFRQVGPFSYNSTFVTGNLRELTDSFFHSFVESDPKARHASRSKSRQLTFICIAFLLGAVLGAWGAPRFGNRTLWFVEPLLLITAIRVLTVDPETSSA